ncbi:type II toxin-antitoxin system VapB family antitoxin [Microbacterium pseudoresistens]|uniref:Antitoxin VapB n=1 Tax=Microbacterium pseudoresistens TaxID=640634 RepID=A0A7Y9ETT4_9MICO|nr:type II toxin-antitoxin system VapB family antitoxin [Microbacterium pseudoresistens]NYD53819.1 antitoxin VapB [Microbacterium pseudoresistens]
MSLNIKNESVHAMVRRLAELTGKSQTGAVEDAVRRRLEEMDHAEQRRLDERAAAIDRAVARLQALPDTGRSIEEIMDEMYDPETGLPR